MVEAVTALPAATTDLNSIEEWVEEDLEGELDIDWQSTAYPTTARGRSVFTPSLSLTCISSPVLCVADGRVGKRGGARISFGWFVRGRRRWTRWTLDVAWMDGVKSRRTLEDRWRIVGFEDFVETFGLEIDD